MTMATRPSSHWLALRAAQRQLEVVDKWADRLAAAALFIKARLVGTPGGGSCATDLRGRAPVNGD
jgi:hypothetical protein